MSWKNCPKKEEFEEEVVNEEKTQITDYHKTYSFLNDDFYVNCFNCQKKECPMNYQKLSVKERVALNQRGVKGLLEMMQKKKDLEKLFQNK